MFWRTFVKFRNCSCDEKKIPSEYMEQGLVCSIEMNQQNQKTTSSIFNLEPAKMQYIYSSHEQTMKRDYGSTQPVLPCMYEQN